MSALTVSSESLPSGYLITFRCYGTWLHGDAGSVDRFHNTYGTPRLHKDDARKRYNRGRLKQPPVKLNSRRRKVIIAAIKKTCSILKWDLWALNVRSNHVHAVVTAPCRPSRVLNALKANSTGAMRTAGCWQSAISPWVRGGSKRYLWNERALSNAIAYVLYDQGRPMHDDRSS
jgi:REP element-mobilizing transposase RayT